MNSFDHIYHRALNLLESGTAGKNVLTFLACEAEKTIGNNSVVSILVLDKNGLLRNGASPQLPEDYLRAIDGIKPDVNIGTCAVAAAIGFPVFTPDFRADDKWAELRHLPISIGFSGAWSMPIKTTQGKILGTFGTYYKQVSTPSNEEITGIGLLSSAAAIALSSHGNLK